MTAHLPRRRSVRRCRRWRPTHAKGAVWVNTTSHIDTNNRNSPVDLNINSTTINHLQYQKAHRPQSAQ
jgi:hypothetical protein